jgi:hypothetical protein
LTSPAALSFQRLLEYNAREDVFKENAMTLPLDALLERVSSAARNLPGAVELYLFGSAADAATRDAYSDLDLQVVSADDALSRSAWPWILNQAGAMTLVYPMGESSFCIAFKNESPYHKVDIGLCTQHERGFLQGVQKKTLLWRQTAGKEPLDISPGETCVPAPGSAGHFLVGELLGSVRYVKARKRAQHLTCWRFLSAKMNALLRCYAWDGQRRNFPPAALNTWDFVALDRGMPEAERLALLAGIGLSSAAEMDRTLLELTRRIAEKIEPEYKTDASRLARLVREYLVFLEQEMGF